MTKENPIYQHMTRRLRQQRTPCLGLTVLGLLVLTSAGLSWLHILDYAPATLMTLASLFCFAGLFIAALSISVTMTVVRRETRAEGYQLLYLTNIAEARMIWGMLRGMALRLRVWLALLIWVGTAGLTAVTTQLAMEENASNARLFPEFILPPAHDVAFFAIINSSIMVLMTSFILTTAVRNGFQRTELAWGTLRTLVVGMLVLAFVSVISSALMIGLTEGSLLWFFATGVVLGCTVAIVAARAQQWRILPRYALEQLADNLLVVQLLWGILVVVVSFVSTADTDLQAGRAQPLTFALFYVTLSFLVSGWLRLFGQRRLAIVQTLHALVLGVVLYFDALSIQVASAGFLNTLALGMAIWVVVALLGGVGVLLNILHAETAHVLLWQVLLFGVLAPVLWLLCAVLLTFNDDNQTIAALLQVLLIAFIGGYGLTVMRKHGELDGVTALTLLLLHLYLLPVPLLIWVSASGPAITGIGLSGMLWGLVLLPYSLTMRTVYGTLRHVWRHPIGG